MAATRKVLIVTYYFPPRPGVASLRLRGLAKYLPEFGWEPTILTATLPEEPDPQFRVILTPYPGDVTTRLKKRLHLRQDKGFQEQIGIPLPIREGKRSFTGKATTFIKGFVAYPDEQKGWFRFAVKTGTELLQKGNIDVLISSSGPVTTHLVAAELKRRFRVQWLADLRDLWTQNPYYSYGAGRKWFEQRLELRTLASADVLVTVSVPLAEKLSALHRGKPVFSIPNGFDPDEVKSAPPTKEFTITYTGYLYQGKRDPELLLQALHELIEEEIIDTNAVKVRFYGSTQYWLKQLIKKYHLEKEVEQYGWVSREVALKKQKESRILLLLNWDDPREKGVYTAKIFEYLAAKRPILAIGTSDGVVNELLKNTQTGISTSSLTSIKDILAKFFKEYKQFDKVTYNGKDNEIQKYSQFEMSRKFADLLHKFVG